MILRSILIVTFVFSIGVISIYAQTNTQVYTSIKDASEAHELGLKVEILNLSKKKLKVLPEALREFTEIVELTLNRNRLTEIPAWISEFTKLEVFRADKNKLNTFPICLLQIPSLKEIHLGDNYITSIPIDIDNLQNLESLHLWSNLIRQFPASLSDITSLQILDLLYVDMTFDEQRWLIEILPEIEVEMSEPCRCTFDD
jgi:Leucine-rich repeat (LRR) protein|tara:strand:- start:1482 stop:2081 length:600 start_codon:yes stop_codon:yes gene_type:complete